jgi:hypothetical protein
MAMLDAILSPEWECRYYSFNASWGSGEQLGSMRNGSGENFFALFNESGCWLKGFAHESLMAPIRQTPPAVWPGVIDQVPKEFSACLHEPAFDIEATTFCTWRRYDDSSWQVGPISFPTVADFPDLSSHPTIFADPDGSQELLSPLDGDPASYKTWADEYYFSDDEESHAANLAAVRAIYEWRPLTEDLVAMLNPDITLDDLMPDIIEIGYP